METITLSEKYEQFRSENPKVRIRDAARQLGTTEAELVATGPHNMRLRPEFENILNEIPALGYVMALTRNDDAVHERKGIYTEATFEGKIGLVVNPDIDLRLFMFSWQFAFAVQEGDRKSIQFFAKDGSAIHKVYLTDKSNEEVYKRLVEKYKMEQVETELSIESPSLPIPKNQDGSSEVDVAAFQKDWLALEDTHHFFAMLKKHGVDRTKAMQIAPEGHSRSISVDKLKALLYQVSEKQVEIMVFIGNKGCIQIHTGKAERLVQAGPWFNILDEEFNMHLREDRIEAVWIVRKPTVDGIVSSVEVFDANGEIIVQFLAKENRNPRIGTLEEILSDIEKG